MGAYGEPEDLANLLDIPPRPWGCERIIVDDDRWLLDVRRMIAGQ